MPAVLSFTTLSLWPIMVGKIKADRADVHAMRRQAVHRFGIFFRTGQKRLRRNAADIKAGAAERRRAFDAGRFHAKLRRADGGDIAAGAGTDNDEVVGWLGHEAFFWEEKIWNDGIWREFRP